MLPAPPTHSAGRECPFCTIAHTYPPLPLTTFLRQQPDPKNDGVNAPATATGTAHLLLSTPSLLAFLDIMPLTRGHILLATREHYEKLSDVPVTVGKQIGQWLPLLSRVVMRTLFGVSDSLDATTAEWNWNVVQNNG
ncbi:uncharacterized protein BP01DRAFT_385788 [Aspergillus saccharolyticus JOP 1030-1]|uniref:HIT domain-containing protein n=1 Tax=Aspergillus saccharolyticus JOP 1030-1 TaxID=1450539 RepID=A0A318Z481_9EURO|nr:hypothetical protein BP01DRAFT_385788 [Aspergillus saccharolyticus JOP 1030-1]PYH42125.1 hypothetical protein BP01DRAFT_385788 [Aspergillus saccharolyticus JOP 1030-1]